MASLPDDTDTRSDAQREADQRRAEALEQERLRPVPPPPGRAASAR